MSLEGYKLDYEDSPISVYKSGKIRFTKAYVSGKIKKVKQTKGSTKMKKQTKQFKWSWIILPVLGVSAALGLTNWLGGELHDAIAGGFIAAMLTLIVWIEIR